MAHVLVSGQRQCELRLTVLLLYVTILLGSTISVTAIQRTSPEKSPTYSDVAPILARTCVPCHQQGEVGPFPLDTYSSVRKRASTIAIVVEDNYMPPQRNDPTWRRFAHERRLTSHEKATLLSWIRHDCPPSNDDTTRRKPPLPLSQSQQTRPDLVLPMPVTMDIPPTMEQTYFCVAIPFEFDRERTVKAIDYVPSNRRLAHHASYQVLEVADDVDLRNIPAFFRYGKDQPAHDSLDYAYFGLISRTSGLPRETFHGGWLPGTQRLQFPPTIGFRLPRRGVVLLRNIHYSPSARSDSDRAEVRMWFGTENNVRNLVFAAFKPILTDTSQTVIRAGDVDTHRIYARIRDNIGVYFINPHMHRLGISFTVWAESPSGDTIRLVRIPSWDFDWQDFYQFESPVHIPAGSILNAIAVYDNTAKNPANPNSPPQDILFEHGMNDDSEMMRLVLMVAPWKHGDDRLRLPEQRPPRRR